MIVIKDRKQFENAIKRAKELKPRVWSNTFGTYFVEGQAQDYKVEFSKVNGEFAGSCTCPAPSLVLTIPGLKLLKSIPRTMQNIW